MSHHPLTARVMSPVQVLMRALGFDVKKPDIVKMVHDIDPNNTGTVNYQQFLEISKSLSRPYIYMRWG